MGSWHAKIKTLCKCTISKLYTHKINNTDPEGHIPGHQQLILQSVSLIHQLLKLVRHLLILHLKRGVSLVQF